MCLCCKDQYTSGVASAEPDPLSERTYLFYQKHKALAILILIIAILIILGLLFIIVWFGILKKGASSSTASSTAHLLRIDSLHLRNFHSS